MAIFEDVDLEDNAAHPKEKIASLFRLLYVIGSPLLLKCSNNSNQLGKLPWASPRLEEDCKRRKLHLTGLKLTAQHRGYRLQFAHDHVDWTIEQWRVVLFSDETRICLFWNDRHLFKQGCLQETVEYGSCMFDRRQNEPCVCFSEWKCSTRL